MAASFLSLCFILATAAFVIVASTSTEDASCPDSSSCAASLRDSSFCLALNENVDIRHLADKDFFHLTDAQHCHAKWRKYAFDILPLDWRTCWFDIDGHKFSVCFYNGSIGYIDFDGEHSGVCRINEQQTIHGDFEGLLVWRKQAPQPHEQQLYHTLVSLLDTYITPEDEADFQEIVGHTMQYLVHQQLNNDNFDDNILSNARFVESEFNKYGLHLLRSILAERILDHKQVELKQHPYYQEWNENGYVLLDYNELLSADDNTSISDFFRILSPETKINIKEDFVKRVVKHVENDKQYELHQDTFHQVVKLWIYDANVSKEHGPLMIVPGSHRVSKHKLKWLYERTKENASDVVEEPSIRFRDELKDYGFQDAIHILPKYGNTLIVADTHALHCRGSAAAGTVRIAYRPKGVVNDGGLKRVNPFDF